jgi:hypothetical protein
MLWWRAFSALFENKMFRSYYPLGSHKNPSGSKCELNQEIMLQPFFREKSLYLYEKN